MGKRKEYTFNITIKKREKTEEDERVYDKAMDQFLDKLLEIHYKKNEKK